jgi:hypothetical protein
MVNENPRGKGVLQEGHQEKETGGTHTLARLTSNCLRTATLSQLDWLQRNSPCASDEITLFKKKTLRTRIAHISLIRCALDLSTSAFESRLPSDPFSKQGARGGVHSIGSRREMVNENPRAWIQEGPKRRKQERTSAWSMYNDTIRQ